MRSVARVVNFTANDNFLSLSISLTSAGLLDALAKGLLSDANVVNARIIATNLSTGAFSTVVLWTKVGTRELGEPTRVDENEELTVGKKPFSDYPWWVEIINWNIIMLLGDM